MQKTACIRSPAPRELRCAVLRGLPAVPALEPLCESWPVGALGSFEYLPVRHGGAFEVGTSELRLDGSVINRRILHPLQYDPAQVRAAQIGTSQGGLMEDSVG